jgi:hypothetical protein
MTVQLDEWVTVTKKDCQMGMLGNDSVDIIYI